MAEEGNALDDFFQSVHEDDAASANEEQKQPGLSSSSAFVDLLKGLDAIAQQRQVAQEETARKQQSEYSTFVSSRDEIQSAITREQEQLDTVRRAKQALATETEELAAELARLQEAGKIVGNETRTLKAKHSGLTARKEKRTVKKNTTFPVFRSSTSEPVNLSKETVELLCGFLTAQDVEHVAQTCLAWHRAITQTRVWHHTACLTHAMLKTSPTKETKSDMAVFDQALKVSDPKAHWHYILTIAVPQPDEYIMTATSVETLNCEATGGRNAPVKKDPSKRAITLHVCEIAKKNLGLELDFCQKLVRQHSVLTHHKLDRARLMGLIEEGEGMKQLLSAEINAAEEEAKILKQRIDHMRQQASSDEITSNFLLSELDTCSSRFTEAQERTARLVSKKDEEIATKRAELASLENERKSREELHAKLVQVRSLLTKEAKSVRDELNHALREKQQVESDYQRLTESLQRLSR